MTLASPFWDRTAGLLLRTEALRNKWLQGAVVAVVLLIVYRLTAIESNPYKQYVLLSDAFLHGRLDLVDPPPGLEVGTYRDHIFVIDPPAPTLFLMPFVAIWGTAINQVHVSIAVGAAAMGLFWVAARQMRWNLHLRVAITLLLALGTNFWWAATDGALWEFAHVSAVFFLISALVEATGARRPWLVGLMVGLAGLSRLPTFLTFPFFAYLLVHREDRSWNELVRDRSNWLRLSLFAAALGAMAAVYLSYNYLRFGSLEDKGYFQPAYASEPWFAKGRFDISYIPRHIDAIFFRQPIVDEHAFPYIKPQWVGMGLFFTTPAFLYAFNTNINRVTLAAVAATLLTLVPLMLHGTTGWTQFGYRYSMDLFPMLAVLTAAGMRHQMAPLKWAVILLSCVIGLWGTLAFNHYGWVA